MKFGQKMRFFFFFEPSKPLSLRIVLQLFQALVCNRFASVNFLLTRSKNKQSRCHGNASVCLVVLGSFYAFVSPLHSKTHKAWLRGTLCLST